MVTTAVGDRYVIAEMLEHDYVLGGEQSGHIINRDVSHHRRRPGHEPAPAAGARRDGPAAARGGDDHGAAAAEARQRAGARPRGARRRRRRLGGGRARDQRLGGDGRVLVRPSGTEPLVRVMAEATTQDECDAVCDRIVAVVRERAGEPSVKVLAVNGSPRRRREHATLTAASSLDGAASAGARTELVHLSISISGRRRASSPARPEGRELRRCAHLDELTPVLRAIEKPTRSSWARPSTSAPSPANAQLSERLRLPYLVSATAPLALRGEPAVRLPLHDEPAVGRGHAGVGRDRPPRPSARWPASSVAARRCTASTPTSSATTGRSSPTASTKR